MSKVIYTKMMLIHGQWVEVKIIEPAMAQGCETVHMVSKMSSEYSQWASGHDSSSDMMTDKAYSAAYRAAFYSKIRNQIK